MRYCNHCLYNDQKPDLSFNRHGTCSACTAYEQRKKTDWENRRRTFEHLAQITKALNRPYDCVVPVSGGKDSTAQVLKCLDHGLRVLACTAGTDDLSDLGRRNLDNISRLGCDHIEIRCNPIVRKRINRFALEQVGDWSWPEHQSIFAIPPRVAMAYRIPLIVWGENPQDQYGGPEWAQKRNILDQAWLEEFGGKNGLRIADIVDAGIATEADMNIYQYPDLSGHNISGVFLGWYYPWSGWENAQRAMDHGWSPNDRPIEGSGFAHENLDNRQTALRDWFKWIKFGMGRATDLASTAIREGRITRVEAVEHVKNWDGMFPRVCIDDTIENVLSKVGMTMDDLMPIIARFTNKKLFHIGNDGFPIPKFEVK